MTQNVNVAKESNIINRQGPEFVRNRTNTVGELQQGNYMQLSILDSGGSGSGPHRRVGIAEARLGMCGCVDLM